MKRLVAGWVRLIALFALVAVQTATGTTYLFERGPECSAQCCAPGDSPDQGPCCAPTSSPCQCSFMPAPSYPEAADQATLSSSWQLVDAVLTASSFDPPQVSWPEPSCHWPESRGPPSDSYHPPFAPRAPPVMA